MEYMELATWVVTVLVPFVATKGGEKIFDKVCDALLEKVFAAFRAKFSNENDLIEGFEKNPTDEQQRVKLADGLAKKFSVDQNFQKELTKLIEEIIRKSDLSKIQLPTVHQLPADVADFTGRKKEIRALLKKVRQAKTTPTVLVLTGLGGTGKSALAIHVAHLLKNQFPTIQLYKDLRGADPQPLSPSSVLGSLLGALGFKEEDLPAELEERAAMYRSALSNSKALILLDNARHEAQVRPLLPASSDSVVLITTRWSLGGLREAVFTQKLTTLAEEDAFALLVKSAGKKRVNADPDSAKKIVSLCGCLPLAIHIAGGQLSVRGIQLQEYASGLEGERERLDKLHIEDMDVRATFMMSYQCLSPREARLFRLLGLLKGESFSSDAAMVLEDGKEEEAWTVLAGLVKVQLIDKPVDTRYGVHDLVRLLAMECLDKTEPDEREAAHLRLTRWYATKSRAMNEILQPEKRAEKLAKLTGMNEKSLEESSQSDLLKALTWFELERANLLAAAEWAHENKEWELTYQLALNLQRFYNMRAHWTDWRRTHVPAWQAARKNKDRLVEGMVLNHLGNLYRLQGRWQKAEFILNKALSLHGTIQNPRGKSISLNLLGNVYRLQGRWDEAIAAFKESLEINRQQENRYGEGIALGGLGNVYRMQGRWDEALQAYDESLKIAEEQQDPRGQSITLNNIGLVYSRQDRLKKAEEVLEKSLSICRELGGPKGDCIARRTLGEVYMRQSRWEEAFQELTKSLEIARKQGDRRCTSQSLNSLGEWYTRRGHWEDADQCFNEACTILRDMNDCHAEGLVLRSKGLLMAAQNRFEEGTTLHREALKKLNESSPEYREVHLWLQRPMLLRKLAGIIS